jgi:hypothetical protein
MVRAGFKEIGYLADMTIRCFREDKQFKAEIVMCKLAPNGPDLEGMTLEDEQLDFGAIIALATGTEPEEWRR